MEILCKFQLRKPPIPHFTIYMVGLPIPIGSLRFLKSFLHLETIDSAARIQQRGCTKHWWLLPEIFHIWKIPRWRTAIPVWQRIRSLSMLQRQSNRFSLRDSLRPWVWIFPYSISPKPHPFLSWGTTPPPTTTTTTFNFWIDNLHSISI